MYNYENEIKKFVNARKSSESEYATKWMQLANPGVRYSFYIRLAVLLKLRIDKLCSILIFSLKWRKKMT